jgi:hypothetical protein
MKFASAEVDHYIQIDLGAGHSDTIGILIIPAGHNLDGVDVELVSGPTSSPATERVPEFSQSGDGVIRKSFGGAGDRYWRLNLGTSGAHEFHQLILTNRAAFTTGYDMRQARDSFRHSFIRFDQPSGISPTLEQGVRRRIMEIPFAQVDDSDATTDLAMLKDWVAKVGMHHPFWIDPPSFAGAPDTADPVTPFKFAEPEPDSAYGVTVPHTETEKKSFTLQLIESVD